MQSALFAFMATNPGTMDFGTPLGKPSHTEPNTALPWQPLLPLGSTSADV